MPQALHVTGSGFDPLGVLYVVVTLLVVFAPVLFARRRSPSAGEEGGEDDQGGRGPRRPSSKPPKPPIGGLPLPDADQSGTRLRDHGRPTGGAPRPQRRQVHTPRRRSPTRVVR